MKSVARCAVLLPCLIPFSTGPADDDWAHRCKAAANLAPRWGLAEPGAAR
jgi:hypothetical protein